MSQDRLSELLIQWHELRASGQESTPEEFCGDCPELLPDFRRNLDILNRMEGLAGQLQDQSLQSHHAPDASTDSRPEAAPGDTQRTGDYVSIKTIVTQPTRSPESLPSIPGYEMLGDLGRGGMGVVYKARQVGLNRLVALKMIKGGEFANEEERARFHAEAEAVARLQHPNVVQIHEVGEVGGNPYFSLEFCEGGSLANHLNGTPLPPKSAASLVETLAGAMHAAHQKGIVHRDLKPANILLSAEQKELSAESHSLSTQLSALSTFVPKVTDFGLAKKLDQVGQTASGAVMGTPSYMAPQQAAGKTKDLGPAIDIYALGAILYELMTGRPPFKAATPVETILQVLEEEPVPPSRLQPKLPRDLETICLKCLDKEPPKRYSSAAALAADLHRFQADEPIAARPAGAFERGWRWCRRKPVVAALTATVALVMSLGIIVSSVLMAVAQKRESEAEIATDLATTKAKEATSEKNRADDAAEESSRNAQQAIKEKEQARRLLYETQMNQVPRAWEDNHIDHLLELLNEQQPKVGQEDFRDFEWHYWWRLCHSELHTLSTGASQRMAFSAHGHRFASVGLDETVKVWDATSGKELLTFKKHHYWGTRSVAFDADGRRLASGGYDGTVKIWDATTGQKYFTLVNYEPNPVHAVWSVAFSPDGRRLACAVGSGHNEETAIIIWDATTGKKSLTLMGHKSAIWSVAFSPDGKRLASASDDYSVKVWDITIGHEVFTFKHLNVVRSVAFSPDGRRLASSSSDGTVTRRRDKNPCL